MLNWKIWVILILVFLIARSVNLLGLPLYIDEGIYIFWAYLIHQDSSFAYVSMQDAKTPFYIWSISFLQPLLRDYLFTGRIISVLGGLVTAISWSVITLVVFKKKNEAIVYFLFMLIIPYAFFIERLAFADSLLTALASVSILLMIIAKNQLNTSKKRIWLSIIYLFLAGIFLGVAFMTKTTAKIFLIAQLGVGLLWLGEFFFRRQFKKIGVLILGLLLFYAAYNEVINNLRVGAYKSWGMIAVKEPDFVYTIPSLISTFRLDPGMLLLNYWEHFVTVSQYYFIYSGVFLILGLIGIIRIFKSDRRFIWVVIYLLAIGGGLFISAKVVASRYFYITIPALIFCSVVGVFVIWNLKNKLYKRLLIICFSISMIQSLVMVVNPHIPIYASDDRDYFLYGDLTALGLYEVKESLKDNQVTGNVGIDGFWGVKEGSLVTFRQNGIDAVSLDRWISNSELDGQGNCPSEWKKVRNSCWQMNLGAVLSPKSSAYLYLTGHEKYLDVIGNFYDYQIVKEFRRPVSANTVVLVKITGRKNSK